MGLQSSLQAVATGAALAASALAFNPPAQAAQQSQPDIKTTAIAPPPDGLDALRAQLGSPPATATPPSTPAVAPAGAVVGQPAPVVTVEQLQKDALALTAETARDKELATILTKMRTMLGDTPSAGASQNVVDSVADFNRRLSEVINGVNGRGGMRSPTATSPDVERDVKAAMDEHNTSVVNFRKEVTQQVAQYVIESRRSAFDVVQMRDEQIRQERGDIPVIGGIIGGIDDLDKIGKDDRIHPGSKPRYEETKKLLAGVAANYERLGLPNLVTTSEKDIRAWADRVVSFEADNAGFKPMGLGVNAPGASVTSGTTEELNKRVTTLRASAAEERQKVDGTLKDVRGLIATGQASSFERGYADLEKLLGDYSARTARGEVPAEEAEMLASQQAPQLRAMLEARMKEKGQDFVTRIKEVDKRLKAGFGEQTE